MVKNRSEAKSSEPSSRKRSRIQRGLHPMPAFLRVSCTILFLMVISIFFTWFIFWRQNLCDADAAWKFVQEKPVLAEYSYLVVFCLLTVIAAVTWRPFFSAGLFFCIISVITFIHIQKFNLRAAPLLPEEFQMADSVGNLIEFIDIEAMWRLIFGVIFTLAGSILAEYYVRKFCGRNPRRLAWWDRIALVPRVTFSMIALALLSTVAGVVINRRDTSWLKGLNLIAWNQTDNYEENGFIIGFLYNMGNDEAKRPDDYSQEAIYEIADKYRERKAADTGREDWDEVIDNLVIILNESFYDPTLLTEHYSHSGGDVTPVLHRIFQEYPSGYMYSPEYGGNTANVEFEVQTGLSNYWAMSFPYVNSVSKMDTLLSAADYGKNMYDFNTLGIHSYDGTMYKRNLVYRILGYDDFIDSSTMKHTERENASTVINDRSIYQEIIDMLEENKNPQVIGAVTMQNHAPYAQAKYDKIQFPLYNRIDDWVLIEASFQSLHESDKYLGEFLEQIDELDERTVVLWFGDHAAGVLESYISSEDKDEVNIAHLTPYFVYANFEIESPYTMRTTAKLNREQGFVFPTYGVDLPTVTPNCLLNTVYNILNISKPSLYYLVDDVCEKVPILARSYQDGKSVENIPALRAYQLVNYDILNGERYWDGS